VTPKRALVYAGALVVVGAATVAVLMARSAMSAMAEPSSPVPTARVVRGAIDLSVHMYGDVRAVRQQAITAPSVGGSLRILSLVEPGTMVHQGDVILEFDPADQLYDLQQAESQVLEAEQEIIKRRADNAAQMAADRVTLLTAQFDVRRAELDAALDADLIPANEYQIRQVTLAEARRTLAQTEQDVEARATTSRAGLTVLEEQRTKASLAAEHARESIDSLVVRAPIDGVVSVRENRDAAGGVFFSGMTLPPYRVGDTVISARPVLDLFDVSAMEVLATVNEQDRANIPVGQPATITTPALPGETFTARVSAVSGLGRAVRTAGPLRLFDVTLTFDQSDARLRPGMAVDVEASGQQVDDVLLLPRQAVFDHEGTLIVWVRSGDGFEPREISVAHRSERRVAVEGIEEGTEVALIAPDASADATAASGASETGP